MRSAATIYRNVMMADMPSRTGIVASQRLRVAGFATGVPPSATSRTGSVKRWQLPIVGFSELAA